MKHLKFLILTILLTSFALTIDAQKIKIESGNLSPLKGEKELNIEFLYDGMAVGKFKNEKEYVAKKKKEYNEKEAGKGDSFEINWTESRQFQYEPKFIELFNKYASEFGMKASKKSSSAKYTIIVKTTFTEPGWNVGISRAPAYTNLEISVIETATKSAVAVVTLTKSPGKDAMGFDYDPSNRIAESYAKGGKEFAQFLEKKISK